MCRTLTFTAVKCAAGNHLTKEGMDKCVKELTASLVIDVSGDHMSLPNRNLETAIVPSSHNSGQVPKEKTEGLFPNPSSLQLSLLNIVVEAQSILETKTFSDVSFHQDL